MANTLYWDPSSDADAAYYDIESSTSASGPWAKIGSIADARPGPAYVAGPPACFFFIDTDGRQGTWYRITAFDAAGQNGTPCEPFRIGASVEEATTVLQVCQMALARIGSTTQLTSIIIPATKEEKLAALFYPRVRNRLLAAFKWPWATRRDALVIEEGAVRLGWQYVYRLPSDLVRVIDIEGLGFRAEAPLMPAPSDRPAWAVEASDDATGRVLCTDVPDATLVYVARIVDPSEWGPEFLDAAVWGLAAELVMPLTAKPELVRGVKQLADEAVSRAVALALNEQRPSPTPDSEFISGRAW